MSRTSHFLAVLAVLALLVPGAARAGDFNGSTNATAQIILEAVTFTENNPVDFGVFLAGTS